MRLSEEITMRAGGPGSGRHKELFHEFLDKYKQLEDVRVNAGLEKATAKAYDRREVKEWKNGNQAAALAFRELEKKALARAEADKQTANALSKEIKTSDIKHPEAGKFVLQSSQRDGISDRKTIWTAPSGDKVEKFSAMGLSKQGSPGGQFITYISGDIKHTVEFPYTGGKENTFLSKHFGIS